MYLEVFFSLWWIIWARLPVICELFLNAHILHRGSGRVLGPLNSRPWSAESQRRAVLSIDYVLTVNCAGQVFGVYWSTCVKPRTSCFPCGQPCSAEEPLSSSGQTFALSSYPVIFTTQQPCPPVLKYQKCHQAQVSTKDKDHSSTAFVHQSPLCRRVFNKDLLLLLLLLLSFQASLDLRIMPIFHFKIYVLTQCVAFSLCFPSKTE